MFFIFSQLVLPVIIKSREFPLSLPFEMLNFQKNKSRIFIHCFYSSHDISYLISGNQPINSVSCLYTIVCVSWSTLMQRVSFEFTLKIVSSLIYMFSLLITQAQSQETKS